MKITKSEDRKRTEEQYTLGNKGKPEKGMQTDSVQGLETDQAVYRTHSREKDQETHRVQGLGNDQAAEAGHEKMDRNCRDADFAGRLAQTLAAIGPERLRYHKEDEVSYQDVYSFIEAYALEHRLLNTAIALPVVRACMDGLYRGWRIGENGEREQLPYMYHCLAVCRMLLDLNLDLQEGEEDILLASALC